MTVASTKLARAQFYLSRGQTGQYLNRTFRFFSGDPTTPKNFTINQLLGGPGGVAANLIDGITARFDVPSCLEIVIVSVGPPNVFVPGAGLVVVPVTYTNADAANDIYVFFILGTGFTLPVISATQTGPDSVDLEVNVLPGAIAGPYSLRVVRADNSACLGVAPNVVTVTPP